jgi:hypothetical protein
LAANLSARWRAEDLVTQVPDGGTVATWIDGVAGISAKGSGQPRLVHDGIGGRATIRFDASDGTDQLRIDRLTSPMTGAQDFSVAVVFATDTQALAGQTGDWFQNTALVDANSLGLANDWGISLNQAGQASGGLGFGFGKPPLTIYSAESGLNDGSWHVVLLRRSGTSISLQVDGGSTIQTADGHANPLSSIDMSIGSQKFESLPFTGQIAEVRVYQGSLDSQESEQLSNELRAFYDNSAPQAVPDTYTLQEDPVVFFQPAAAGVLANDTDQESDSLTAVLVDNVKHGKLTFSDDGSFFYDPHRDFFGTDTFTYAALDWQQSAPVTVTLNVLPIYDPATPLPDSFKAIPRQVFKVLPGSGVLANDTSPDKVALRAVLHENVGRGSLALNADGSFQYDPQGFAGVTSFSYRVDDGTSLSDPVPVSLTVNTPPMAREDIFQVQEDQLLVRSALQGVLQNDGDSEGNTLTVAPIDLPAHGTLTLQSSGAFSYLPAADFFGEDSFTYEVSDGFDTTAKTAVRLNVTAVNDVPAPQPDRYVGLPDQPLDIGVSRGVLRNDVDVDSPALSAQLVGQPAHGTLELRPDGSFLYKSAPGFLGEDSFAYRASDGQATSPVTRVDLTITEAPVIISEFMSGNSKFVPTRTRPTPDDSFAGDSTFPDWIELENLTAQAISLEGMHLTDDRGLPKKWTFPAGSVIPASGRLIVYASGLNITDPANDEMGRLHTNFSLAREGDYLALSFVDGTPISAMDPRYPDQRTDVSYGLFADQFQYFPVPTPGDANSPGLVEAVEDASFSANRGFITDPFSLTITTATPGATIVYTTDGSEPTLANGTQVLPTVADQLPVATLEIAATTTLRVAAFKEGLLPSNVDTQTYIFVSDVLDQSNLWGTVTDHPEWGPLLKDSLLALPTVSLVTPGRISERETSTSVEMFFPDGSEPGFQIDAGIEHYGGHSLSSPKKNMRLSFKSKYGNGSLKYDLFGEGAVDEFEQLLLRTGSHDTFFWTHPGGGRGNYLRNRWAFDRQLEMGQPAPHGRFVHVYINGTYWGMHELMERPEADFMASYLGGFASDYDALNAGTPVDGDLKAWQAMQREEVIDNYDELQKYLDLDNYADYMLLQFYGGNDWDWNTEQNWMSARKREEGAGYMFFAWDSDVILRTTANANVINRGGPSNLWNVRGGVKQHKEFLMLMADRAQKYFFEGGMFSDERLRSDIETMASSIRLAIIAETARWGRTDNYTPDSWEDAVDWMLERFAPEGPGGRAETVIQQLRRARIYPSIDAPFFTVNGTPLPGGDIESDAVVKLQATNGSVYFTLDGSDPRLPGGELNPAAMLATEAGLTLARSSNFKARALHEGEWSTIVEARFRVNTVTADSSNLRITEVQYHPADPNENEQMAGFGNADEFEYIELFNISSQTLDLKDVQFVTIDVLGDEQGVKFDFATSEINEIPPGGRLVVVEDVEAFQTRYGGQPLVAGQWEGALSNASETITLRNSHEIIHQFTYSDEWYPETDGEGPALQVVNERELDRTAWQRSSGWRASRQAQGTPGSPDEAVPGDANHDGIFNSSDLVLVFVAGEYEDGVGLNSTWEEGDWNGDGDFTTADLVAAFVAGRYVSSAMPIEWPLAPTGETIFHSARRDACQDAGSTGLVANPEAVDAVLAQFVLQD